MRWGGGERGRHFSPTLAEWRVRNKPKSQLDAEERIARGQANADALARVSERFITAAMWVAIVYYASQMVVEAVSALAGKTTLAHLALGLLANLNLSITLAWSAAAASTIWAILERKAKRDNIERLSERIRRLERGLDPRRSSSRLTPRGETHPDDRR